MNLRYTKRAAAQIEAAISHVAERSPRSAGKLTQRLHVLLTLLTEQPHAGQLTTRIGVRRLPPTLTPI